MRGKLLTGEEFNFGLGLMSGGATLTGDVYAGSTEIGETSVYICGTGGGGAEGNSGGPAGSLLNCSRLTAGFSCSLSNWSRLTAGFSGSLLNWTGLAAGFSCLLLN